MSKNMLLTLEEKVDPRWTALIVVDYQNDFVAEEGVFGRVGFEVERFRAIEPDLSQFIPEIRRREIPVIFIKCVYNSDDNRYLSDVFLSQALRTRSGVYHEHPLCVEGTWGCDFYGEVKPLPEDIIVVKHRFNAFINTDLDLILRSMGVRTLIFTGIATHVCVESTVRHAFFHDYYNVVVQDCVAT
jgi:ureidoacrylate peracid hydrolase